MLFILQLVHILPYQVFFFHIKVKFVIEFFLNLSGPSGSLNDLGKAVRTAVQPAADLASAHAIKPTKKRR
jgi:hypothetical protein